MVSGKVKKENCQLRNFKKVLIIYKNKNKCWVSNLTKKKNSPLSAIKDTILRNFVLSKSPAGPAPKVLRTSLSSLLNQSHYCYLQKHQSCFFVACHPHHEELHLQHLFLPPSKMSQSTQWWYSMQSQ